MAYGQAVSNKITSTSVEKQKPKFSVAIATDGYKKMINNALGDPKVATKFIGNISSVVSLNPKLQDCDPGTIISAGLVAASLNLSMAPTLGYCYLVPYNETKWNSMTREYEVARVTAQFQIGWKGYFQLAMRSGLYKSMNILAIKKCEYVKVERLSGELITRECTDEELVESEVIGYYAEFTLLNGFKKAIYISKKEMEIHADTYSKAFSISDYNEYKKLDAKGQANKKYSSFWYKNFDAMALKTVVRQLLGKYGPMSTELQEAYQKDQTEMKANGEYEYIDSKSVVDDTTGEVNVDALIDKHLDGEIIDTTPEDAFPPQNEGEAPTL